MPSPDASSHIFLSAIFLFFSVAAEPRWAIRGSGFLSLVASPLL